LEYIASNLHELKKDELMKLQKWLACKEPVDKEDACEAVVLFKSICLVVDDLQSGVRSKEFNGMMERVFQMYSHA
jgi:hypothetical protein